MATRWTRRCATALAVASTGLGLAIVAAQPAHAAPGDIVINEIMYNADAAGPTPNLEFLELHNRGGTPVDISGWRITDAFTINAPGGVVPAGTSIPAGGYFVIAGDLPSFSTAFPSVTPDLSFDPVVSGLAGGGETVSLADSGGNVIDTVPYDDAIPWPLPPDGGGPSLELIDPFSDNAAGGSWAASAAANGTPRAQNSRFNAPPPSLTNVSITPTRPNPSQAMTVQATAAGATSATLTYKVMFGTDVNVPMTDTGGGHFTATIPGQAAGHLVRYRIVANLPGGPLTHPPAGDSRTYDGVVVLNPAVASAAQLPVLEWFIDDAGYNGLLRTVCDQVEYPGVITWQGTVYDNATFRRRGHTSCNDPKPKIEMQLPAGYAIDFSPFAAHNASPFSGPIDEFALNNEAYPIPGLGWENLRVAGDPSVGYLPVRVQRNAQFFGASVILEEYDGSWRDRKGWNDGAFYKVEAGGFRTYATADALRTSGDFDKKDPDDTNYSDVWSLTQVLNQAPSTSKTAWIYANIDIPQMVNYMALTVELRHWDSGGKNFYVFRDASSTGRWRILHWDLDGIFSGGSDTKGDFVTPDTSFNRLYRSLLEIPAIKEMYFRRLRTLHDQYLVPAAPANAFVQQFDALTVGKDADRVLDRNKWGGATLSSKRTKVIDGVNERRTQIAAHTNANEVPTSQSGAPNVVINEIQPNGDPEFLELHNPSTTEAVDISGWQLTGVGSGSGAYSIPPGTVIPKGGYVVFVSKDAPFRMTYGNAFVGGQFPGGLSSSGEPIQLSRRDGSVADAVTYSFASPWPPAPTGTLSIELKDPALDNSQGGNWAVSTGNATPGARNTAFGGGPGPGPGPSGCSTANATLDFGDTWCYMATGGDLGTAWRAEAFDDSSWPSGPGMLGFKNSPLGTTVPSTSGRTTYYFRTRVNVPDVTTLTSATLNAVIDDGAIVYVNGVEAARHNLPAGAISFTQKATVDITGSAENTPVALSIPVARLHNGTNTIAIEVHNKANAPGDLGLDAELRFNTGGPGPGPGGSVLLPFGATWKYLDTGVDQGTAWRAAGFDDAAWASGPGMLGFQNTGVDTVLTRATGRTTYYFRTTFNVATPGAATLELVRDDGAVIYINGVEVARSNMPAGTIAFSTKASTEITGAAETTAVSIPIPAGALTAGTNTIAIEVHQIGNAEGDLSMDARLTLN